MTDSGSEHFSDFDSSNLIETSMSPLVWRGSLIIRQKTIGQMIIRQMTIRQKDNSSKRQFVKKTIRQKDNLSKRQFVKKTIRRKDNLSNLT